MQYNPSFSDAVSIADLDIQSDFIANNIYGQSSDSLKGRTGDQYRLVADVIDAVLTTIAFLDTIDEAVVAITAMQKLMQRLADEADKSPKG
jgi:hypothetical protein